MRYRTFIALCVHIALAALLSIYLVFFHVDSSVKELKASDIRIVIDSQEEFDEAIKTDGRIYALGEIRGSIKASDISLDDLEFDGKDKEDKVETIKSYLDGEYVYIDFFSEELSEKTVKEKDPYDPEKYVLVTKIVGEPYAYLKFYDTFGFYGQVFPNTEGLMHSVYEHMESTLIDGRAKEHVISAAFLSDKQPMWLEFTVSNGQINMESVGIHSTNSAFDYTAKAAMDRVSAWEVVGGVFLFAAICFGVTLAIMRGIDNSKIMLARYKRKRGL